MNIGTEPCLNEFHILKKPQCGVWLVQFVLYNLIFLIIQFFSIYLKSSSFIHAVPLPPTVYLEFIFTLCVHLGLYFLLSIAQTTLLWGLAQHRFTTSIERWQIIIWSISICAILTSNAYFFPLSSFNRFLIPELPSPILIIVLGASIALLGALLLNALYFMAIQYPKFLVLSALIALGVIFYPIILSPKQFSIQPNIIMIGIDSLPLKQISLEHTPTIAQFIKRSTYFKETISPLARTYPAWATILTGLYPQHHGARYNLMPSNHVKSDRSIGWLLQKSGYHTIFATDDRQFNNMGQDFGFQEVIGPKVGVNDLLLGAFNDLPLSNLLINCSIARWLFPYNYINRASRFAYYPQTFDRALQNKLALQRHDLPVFLAVHFTLPHWPYTFASSPPALVNGVYSIAEQQLLISKAIAQADQQVAHLLHALQTYGYLNNSLVILLSDHGETLYIPGSRLTRASTYQGQGPSPLADYLKRKTSTTLEQSAGHGSDLLSPDQYHCLLAFKIFKEGRPVNTSKIITTRVALLDIAPTIQAFSGLESGQRMDGMSLLNNLYDEHTTLIERAFIMESGMLPNQLITAENASKLGRQYFTVNTQNNQLHIREQEITTLDAMKLYAIIEGDWVLALYPDDNGYIPITQRLSDGQWVDDLTSDFSQSSPDLNMLKKIEHFYRKPWVITTLTTHSRR